MTKADIDSVCMLLESIITNTYKLNNIKNDDLFDFIAEKQHGVKTFVSNDISTGIYKCVIYDDALIGIGGIYPVCDDIKKNIPSIYHKDLEIGSIYIDPSFQRMGIANRIMTELIKELDVYDKEYFFLDCGYRSSQIYWANKLGTPYKRLASYFGKDEHYLIWKVELRKAKEIFKI